MKDISDDIKHSVKTALVEDVGSGDISAALIPRSIDAQAVIKCRQQAVICGTPWVEEVFSQIEPSIKIEWLVSDGDFVQPETEVARISGPACEILTGERTALNFLQTLSATSTQTRQLVDLISGTPATLLDTRKTIPGLRTAQKYAVRIGGGHNHRIGLFDAFLIKENHIAACGGITAAISGARALQREKKLEIEVQDLKGFSEALINNPDVIMLDNFTTEKILEAVALNRGRCILEASGGIDEKQLVKFAKTGVDYISLGSLTKHCKAVDFSLLFQSTPNSFQKA